ncbi:MAG: hypothetical protein AAF389_07905 [Gemmatimonadota bacterium]
MSLHPLVGHEAVRASIARAASAGVLPSSLLLHGPRGVGKQHLAQWIARLTVCPNPTADGPCDVCGPCRMALNLEHPDIHWYFPLPRPKGASREKLAEALERARLAELAERREYSLRPSGVDGVQAIYLGAIAGLRATAAKRPTMAPGPVFIVGQAESLVPQEASQEAANALLKLLEEPPGQTRFILTSSEPGMLLPTIRSRTVPVHVPALPAHEVRAFLDAHLELESRVSKWATDLSQGSPGRALAFLPEDGELGPLEALRRRAFEIVRAATAPAAGAGHAVAMGFPPAGARALIDLFTFVEEWLRDLGAAAAGAETMVIHQDALSRLHQLVSERSIEAVRVADAFTAVERARELARGNVNPQLVVSGLIRDLRRSIRQSSLAGTS